MSSRDEANLLAILDSIQRIREYTKGISSPDDFFKSSVVFDATLMNFVNIGEMADRVSISLRDQYNEVDWRKIKDFRNLVAHDYLGVDAEEVWQIIKTKLPELREQIKKIINY